MSVADMLTTLASRLTNILSGINAKLTAKGAAEAATFDDIETRIESIQVGDDTTITTNVATAADILSPKKAWANGEEITGTMADNGTISATLSGSKTSQTIPEGYTSGGSVSISLDTTNNSATPSTSTRTYSPSSGKVFQNFTVNAMSTGALSTPTVSISSNGTITATAGVSTSGYISSGTTKGSSTYTLSSAYDSDFVASNIKSGVNIFGLTGTYVGDTGGYDVYTLALTSQSDSEGSYIVGSSSEMASAHGGETPLIAIYYRTSSQEAGVEYVIMASGIQARVVVFDSDDIGSCYTSNRSWLTASFSSSGLVDLQSTYASGEERGISGDYTVILVYTK